MLGSFQSSSLTSRLSDWKEASRSFQLPATDGSARSKNRTINPKRILIVEDNIDSARSLALLVHEIGHRAEYAINGYAALAAAKTFRPEVILLDLGLPGMSGFEFCSRIKADDQMKATRIFVLSAYADDESRSRTKALGCELHLVKPVPTDVLEELLR